MRRILLCVHGVTGNKAGCEAVGRDSLETGIKAPQKKRPLARFRLRSSANPELLASGLADNYRPAAVTMPFFINGGVCRTSRSWVLVAHNTSSYARNIARKCPPNRGHSKASKFQSKVTGCETQRP